ncbi:MAG: hypothetical protein V9F03_03155 [Microthrixaceae bacterium]
MKKGRKLEKRIAVFGESGSGKTVLLSSFYGAAQEPTILQKSLYHIVAEDVGLGNRLHQNYLGMRDSAQVPAANRFSGESYSFAVKLKDDPSDAWRKRPFDALRLVWHDYPGEWFEQDVSGPAEAQRRVDTFRSLLNSDVAFLLVDGQRLVDNAGEEERYLKLLLSNFRNGLLNLRDDLLTDGKPLEEFPRIWMIALSKCDLLPEMDVYKFKEMMIGKVAGEIEELRRAIAGMIDGPHVLSVGEDFMLLSSARFEAGEIEVTRRVGLDLILPLAAMESFRRHVKWASYKQIPGGLAETMLQGAMPIAFALVTPKNKWAERLYKLVLRGKVADVLMKFGPDFLTDASRLAGHKLAAANANAKATHDNLLATITGFQMDLERAEGEKVLLRSRT